VHPLVHHAPNIAISTMVNRLKGVTSRRQRQQCPMHVRKYLWGNHFWSPSYCVASCGGAPLSIIKQYIEQQNRPINSGTGSAGRAHRDRFLPAVNGQASAEDYR
jgi:putative transposase